MPAFFERPDTAVGRNTGKNHALSGLFKKVGTRHPNNTVTDTAIQTLAGVVPEDIRFQETGIRGPKIFTVHGKGGQEVPIPPASGSVNQIVVVIAMDVLNGTGSNYLVIGRGHTIDEFTDGIKVSNTSISNVSVALVSNGTQWYIISNRTRAGVVAAP